MNNFVDEAANKRKKKRTRPKLKPIKSPEEKNANVSPELPRNDLFGNFQPSMSDKHDVDPATAAEKNEFVNSTHYQLTTPPKSKLMPRLSSRSRTPDDDDYDAFGFGLVKQNDRKLKGVAPKKPVEVAVTSQTSSISLRRVLSSDSYISDDSSSSADGTNTPPKRIHRETSDEDTHDIEKGMNADDDRLGQSASVQVGQSFQRVVSNNVSLSSSGSSDGESSYFSAHRAQPQSHPNHPASLTKHQLYQNIHQDAQNMPVAAACGQPKLSLRIRSNSLPNHSVAEASLIELKLSLSEDDDVPSVNGRMMGSSPAAPSSSGYGIVSSIDDQVIANELTAYTISDKSRQFSVDSDGHHASSIIGRSTPNTDTISPARHFSTSSQSVSLTATSPSLAKPRAHHDTSFLTNLREDWQGGSIASGSEGSFILRSPRGAFGEPEAETRSPHDISLKSSGTHTPQSNYLSLAYSDEEDNERMARGLKLLCCRKEEEELARSPTNDILKVKLYPVRWIMLLCTSILNLLCSMTCFSIAPISALASEALEIDPENLVALFLFAETVSIAIEPVILSRLGLRRTILLGSLFLMIGNVVKGNSSWKSHLDKRNILYLGFFISGLSRPSRTATFIVNSWFPKWERAFAMGMILQSRQFGGVCAFLFGVFLVKTSADLYAYFHILSMVTTVLFVANAMQLEDAPPTPPSKSVKIIRDSDGKNFVAVAPRATGLGRIHSPKTRRSRHLNTHEKKGAPRNSTPYKQPLLPSPASFGTIKTFGAMDTHITGATSSSSAFGVLSEGSVVHASYGSTDTDTSLAGLAHALSRKLSHIDESENVTSPFPNLTHDSPGVVQFGLGHYFDQDEGAEPILVQTPRHFDINIHDNQTLCSIRACFVRKGFSHCILAYSLAGIIINTLSTHMDYLIPFDGAHKEYVGFVGATFHLLLIFALMICRRWKGKSHMHFIAIVTLLAVGCLLLALCSANLDSEKHLCSILLMVALYAGALQCLSSGLGMQVASTLSENTVLVIQQFFSSLLSAVCIPIFKVLRGFSATLPDFTYSFYLLIFLHILVILYFASSSAQCLYHEGNENMKEQRKSQPLHFEAGNLSLPNPKPPLGRDQPRGQKYPFHIPSNSL